MATVLNSTGPEVQKDTLLMIIGEYLSLNVEEFLDREQPYESMNQPAWNGLMEHVHSKLDQLGIHLHHDAIWDLVVPIAAPLIRK